MTTRRKTEGPAFQSISQNDLPDGRKGKHHTIVKQLIDELQRLDHGRALKIPLAELPDSKANIRSALTRSAKQKGIDIATSSDEGFLYVWKPDGKADGHGVAKAEPAIPKKAIQPPFILARPSTKPEAGNQ